MLQYNKLYKRQYRVVSSPRTPILHATVASTWPQHSPFYITQAPTSELPPKTLRRCMARERAPIPTFRGKAMTDTDRDRITHYGHAPGRHQNYRRGKPGLPDPGRVGSRHRRRSRTHDAAPGPHRREPPQRHRDGHLIHV